MSSCKKIEVGKQVYQDYGRNIPTNVVGEKVCIPKKDSYKITR